jgi:CRISPR-associated endonuclease/helicase Cas3
MLQVPLKELRAILTGEDEETDPDADVEGATEPEESGRRNARPAAAVLPFVVWRGRDDCKCQRDLKEVRPGDTIVLAADEGDADVPARTFELLLPGAPADQRQVDVYQTAYLIKHGVIRRLHRTFAAGGGHASGEIDLDTVIEAMEQAIPAEERDRFFRKPKAAEYGPGFYHVTGQPSDEPLDVWQSDDDEDESLYTGNALPLEDHTRHVATAAAALSQLVPDFAAIIANAAELHDIGKADSRFQHLLYGRRPGAKLLGKSGRPRLAPWRERLLYLESKLPRGFRHEVLSMQMVARNNNNAAGDPDLLLHLIAAHHGHCRPFAPVIDDPEPPPASCPTRRGERSITREQRTDPPPYRLDSGVAERFWRLTRRYGWWGLAYLEAILRCADTHASAYADGNSKREDQR